MEQNCEAIVISCIDFRFYENISNWLAKNFKPNTFDRGAFAGSAKNLQTILSQVEMSVQLHKIKKVVLINHEDCGAYGKNGHPLNHASDLQKAKIVILKQYPNIEVNTYYLRLDGVFEQVS